MTKKILAFGASNSKQSINQQLAEYTTQQFTGIKTMTIGFLLLCSFCLRIIVSEIVSGQFAVMGIIVSIMYDAGTYLRKSSLFEFNTKTNR